jgi:hypothetical protein
MPDVTNFNDMHYAASGIGGVDGAQDAVPAPGAGRRSPKRSGWGRGAAAALAALAFAMLVAGKAQAQAPDRLTMVVAPTITAESSSEIRFPIRVGPAPSIPGNSFVRVRGLPQMAALSEGYSIGPGAWSVPLSALSDLKIALPVSLAGKSEVLVSLVGVDGAVLVEVKTILVVTAPPSAGTIAIVGAPARLPAPPAIAPEDRERALKLVAKGDEQLAQGLVAPARLLYERAADLGLAQAAMALAATFDAAELKRPNLRGIQPDAMQAKRWYERARTLGAADAEQRLGRLDRN